MSIEPANIPSLFRMLWHEYVVPEIKPPGVRYDIEVFVSRNGWELVGCRYIEGTYGEELARSYRQATVFVDAPQLLLMRQLYVRRKEVVEEAVASLRELLRLLSDRLPKGWRLFGRPRRAVKRMRLWRAS